MSTAPVHGSATPLGTSLFDLLEERFTAALDSLGEPYAGTDPQLRPAARPEFGHYSSSVSMRLAKVLKKAPREVAETIAAALDVAPYCLAPQVAANGMINLTLDPAWLATAVTAVLADPRCGVPLAAVPQRVVVDYSSPNVAKELHVGHLRSSVIGDSIVRTLSFLGHDVVRRNHVGDWGTPFAVLLLGSETEAAEGTPAPATLPGLCDLYRRSRARFDSDPAFADAARAKVVMLQSGDLATLAAWKELVSISVAGFTEAYERLGITLRPEDVVGESAYNDALAGVVSELQAKGLVTVSDGAKCVFLEGYVTREGEPLPLIVQKSDGGYGYAATDLAAVRNRVEDLGADKIAYVVDARQALHFNQVFETARLAGWLLDTVEAVHVPFGTVLGEDGRPLKTRAGKVVSLESLLAEADQKALALFAERGSGLPQDELASTAHAVAMGAVKYADLSSDRTKDYVFDLDKMVSMDGNTGPYLQYAHARLISVLAKAGEPVGSVKVLVEPAEVALAAALVTFPEAVQVAADTLSPHKLATALYDVATKLSRFYESCPVLKSEGEIKESRVALVAATRDVLAAGLSLLGIETPPKL